MKISCGTDIIEVARIQNAIEDMGDKFLNKIYTTSEIEYCKKKGIMCYQHFAARFEAKEAIFKAISQSLENKYDVSWKDAQILNNEEGRPYVQFLNNKIKNIEQIDISMSHIKDYAIASCIIVFDEGN